MSCMPLPGGHERTATDALVAQLNSLEGKTYRHKADLDKDNTRAQPESLYVDSEDSSCLVIELKSISWPEDYPYGHSKDHHLVTRILALCGSVSFEDLFVLIMPSAVVASNDRIENIAECVSGKVQSLHSTLVDGQDIKFNCMGWFFVLRVQPVEFRDDSMPATGLGFEWPTDWAAKDPDLHLNLDGQIKKYYAACRKKFSHYATARRILMLDPHGEVQFLEPRRWNEILKHYPPPPEVDEVWIGIHGADDFGDSQWAVDKIWGGSIDFPEMASMIADGAGDYGGNDPSVPPTD